MLNNRAVGESGSLTTLTFDISAIFPRGTIAHMQPVIPGGDEGAPLLVGGPRPPALYLIVIILRQTKGHVLLPSLGYSHRDKYHIQ